jgi:hypothetical protein
MSQNYKIVDVSAQVGEFTGTHGTFKTYKIGLDGVAQILELVQKPETRPPQVGDELYGDVDLSGKFPRFKKAQAPQGGSYKPKPMGDSYAMFLSYSKDIATKLLESTEEKWDNERFDLVITSVARGADTLWALRPDAKKEEIKATVEKGFADNVSQAMDSNDIPF